jgi:hypothetical protein
MRECAIYQEIFQVEPNTIRHRRLTGENLRKTAPGLYVDDRGEEYFYLTDMFVCVSQRMLRNPELYTPAFIVDVLDELRESFHLFRMELMD